MAIITPKLSPDFKVLDIEPIATDLFFTESPRYRDGYLYVSDMLAKKIWKIDPVAKTKEVLIEVPNQPNGSGFLSDGTFVVGSMFDACIYQIKDINHPKLELYKDLKPLMTGYTGDMLIDADDNIYMDDVGARLHHGEAFKPGRLIKVTPEKEMMSVAEDLYFPNGIVLDNKGEHLYIGETHSKLITVFDFDKGRLSNRQVWLNNFDCIQFDVEGDGVEQPRTDGLCIDAEDAIWCSFFSSGVFLRITQEGLITHRVNVDGEATTVMLGGEDGKTLFFGSNAMPRGKDENVYENMNQGKSIGTIYMSRAEIGRGTGRP